MSLIHPGFDPQSQANRQDIDNLRAKVAPLYVLNNGARETINSLNPEIILNGTIDVLQATKVEIHGTINGTFNYVCSIAVYVDDVPIGIPADQTGQLNHPDCMITTFDSSVGTTNQAKIEAYHVVTDELAAGLHTIKVGVVGFFNGNKHTVYINNVSGNNIASSSTLVVAEFR